MPIVTISIGSNIERDFHLRESVRQLRHHFGELQLSPVYETAAVGFEGEDFYNLAALFETDRDVFEVASILKQIEDQLGRDRSQPRFSARSIDLDLLTYDDLILDRGAVQVPRHEVVKNAFVLKPLSDIYGTHKHPELQQTYQELWLSMAPDAERINRVDFQFE